MKTLFYHYMQNKLCDSMTSELDAMLKKLDNDFYARIKELDDRKSKDIWDFCFETVILDLFDELRMRRTVAEYNKQRSRWIAKRIIKHKEDSSNGHSES